MAPEVWSYVPQRVLAEHWAAPTRTTLLGPRATFVGAITSRQQHTFRLQYGPVASAEVNSMLAFFQAREGALEAFDFPSPNDGITYSVRFAGTMRAELFTPVWFQTGGTLDLIQTRVPSLAAFVASSLDPDAGSGGQIPPPSSGDGPGPEAFRYPGNWYFAGWYNGDRSNAAADKTSNELLSQAFFSEQSGVALDALGLFVSSGKAGQWANLGLYSVRGSSGSVFDPYPSSLVAATSIDVSTMGWQLGSVSVVLAEAPYWVSFVTSFTGTGAMFGTLPFAETRVFGQESGDTGDGNQAITWAHSFDLPTTFPSSATHDATNVKMGFRVGSA